VSLPISIFWVWNVKLGNLNRQEGKFACESAHGDILNVKNAFKVDQNMAGQISKNTHKMPNKIFAAKPLLKTTKFSQFDR